MNVLTISSLNKSYEKFQLRDVSFEVRQGEIMGFIGRNGAGKTTTLKSLLNLVHPDSGEISFFGKPFAGNELDIKRRIGFVSGGVDYYIRSKLRTITAVTRRFYPNWDEAAYSRYMTMFKLDEGKTPSALSAGMKVKYNLALALSHHAELLILDEPTSGLDPVSREDLLDVFLELAHDGASILFSTHITADLDKCADRITYIRAGRILASEGVDEFEANYRLLTLEESQPAEPLASRVLGVRRARHGCTALISAADAEELKLTSSPADLDTIMVHLEKEGE